MRLKSEPILGLPIPVIAQHGPAASAVILADRESANFAFTRIAEVMAEGTVIRLFGKPVTLKNRRMGVALAMGETIEEAVARAEQAATKVNIRYLA